jgi:purine nucleoside phosphorylase
VTKAVLGIIGGSGIYDLPGLEKVRQKKIKSPWGEPSAALRIGEIGGTPVVFLSRHDKGHRLSPSDINYRANIDVLKRADVTDLVSLSACGSFKQELPPGTFVLIDQFVDRTFNRKARSSARAASPMSRWRIRCRRACRTASPPPPASRASRSCAGASMCAWRGRSFPPMPKA